MLEKLWACPLSLIQINWFLHLNLPKHLKWSTGIDQQSFCGFSTNQSLICIISSINCWHPVTINHMFILAFLKWFASQCHPLVLHIYSDSCSGLFFCYVFFSHTFNTFIRHRIFYCWHLIQSSSTVQICLVNIWAHDLYWLGRWIKINM